MNTVSNTLRAPGNGHTQKVTIVVECTRPLDEPEFELMSRLADLAQQYFQEHRHRGKANGADDG